MADMDNFENIQESFNYITEALDSMRAQNAVNNGNLDRLMTEISNNLDVIAKDDTAELIKVFLVELKKGIDDRHDFVTQKFSLMEKSFDNIIERTQKQLTGNEIKELFEIIATNLGGVIRNFDSQKDLINNVGLKVDALQKDESQKDEIIRNISVLKIEMEKVNNGFQSTVLNLNDNFEKVNDILKSLDTKDAFAGLKKDIENIFMSSNAILSTMQVIDHKNRELEETINTFVTKDDFNVEREQVAKLIAQNIQLTDYIEKLPTQSNFEDLTSKIDTSIGIINALKNMLTETGKQNQEMLIAQLDNLESKILNISTEEEFIGFRKELSEFAKEVMESTNLIRADLADTNQGLKSLYEFLNTMDIKNSFLNFTEITKTTEASLKNTISSQSSTMIAEMTRNQEQNKNIVLESITRTKDNIEKAKSEINDFSQSVSGSVIEQVRLVNDNVESVKNTIKAINDDNLNSIDEKLGKVKEDITNASHFVIQNSQKGFETILTDVDKIFNELMSVKQNVSESTISISQDSSNNLQVIENRLQQTKEEMNATAKESLDNMLSVVEEFSQEILKTKETIETGYGTNTQEIKEILSGLSLKLNSLQDVLTKGYEVNFADVRNSVEELNNITQATKAVMEKNTTFGFSGLAANMEELSNKLEIAENSFDIKSQANLEKISALFADLKKEVELSKDFLKDSNRSNYDVLSESLVELGKKIEAAKNNVNSTLKNDISAVHSSVLSLPEIIKQNNIELDAKNTELIEKDAENIKEILEKIEGLAIAFATKDNPFKEDVFFNFNELQSKIDTIKQDFNKATFELDDSVSNQINSTLRSIESLINQYTEQYNSAFGELKGNIQEYFVSVNKIYNESDEKLSTSLSETYEIKADLENLKDRITEVKEDSKIFEVAAELHRRFDAVLQNISDFEQSVSSGRDSFSSDITGELENKFNAIIAEINEAKKSADTDSNELLITLGDKTEELKGQMNLASTDIMNTLSARSTELASILIATSENIDKVAKVDFNSEFMNLKNKVDNVLLSTSEIISKEVENGNNDQLDKINSEFKGITETLSVILSKVSSDNTREIIELRSILTERVDNISSINNILGALLEQMNAISAHFDVVNNNINSAKEELLDKINQVDISSVQNKEEVKSLIGEKSTDILNKVDLIESSLIQTHEETREQINEKTAETQNRATAVLVDKINETSEDIKSLNSQMIYQYKYETQEAIADLRQELLARPIDFQPVIDTIQNSTQEGILNAKDEILNKANTNGSALSDSILETKEVLGERLSTLEGTLSQAQEDSKNLILEEISSSREDLRDSLFSKIEDAKDETKRAFINKMVESQEDSKNDIISGIAEFNDKNNTAILYGIKENLAQISQELSAEYKEVISENRAELVYKLTGVADNLEQFSASANAHYEKLSSSQNEKGELLQSISQNQNKNTSILNGIRQTQEENKNVILDESRQIQETLKVLLSENLTEEQAKYREFILNELARIQGNSKEEIVQFIQNRNEETTNLLLREIREIQDGIAQGVIENLAVHKDTERFKMLEDFKQIQEESRTATVEKLSELSEENRRVIFDEVETSLNEIKSNIDRLIQSEESVSEDEASISDQMEGLKLNIENMISALDDKISQAQETRTAQIEDVVTNVKTGFYEKVEDSFDCLKSFIEVLADRTELNEELEDFKIALMNKLSDSVSDIDCSVSSISVKSELQDFVSDVELTIGNVFGQIKEDVLAAINNSNNDEQVSEKIEMLTNSVETLKTGILAEISDKFEEFGMNLATQTSGINSISEEILKSAEDLKIAISDSNSAAKDDIINCFHAFKDSITETTDKLKEIDFSEKFEELAEISADIIKEEISAVSEKLDNLINKEADSETAVIVDEISKDIGMMAQDVRDLLEKVDNATPEISEKLSENKAELIEQINALSEKLDISIQKAETAEVDRNYLKDNVETLINVANSSSSEISDIAANTAEIKENLESVVNFTNDYSLDRTDLKSNLEELKESSEAILSKIDNSNEIKNRIQDSLEKLEFVADESSIDRNELKTSVSEIKEGTEALLIKLDESEKARNNIKENTNTIISKLNSSEEDRNSLKESVSTIGEKIEELISKSQAPVEIKADIQESIFSIEDKINNLSDRMEEPVEVSGDFKEEISALSQKFDVLIMNSDSDDKIDELSLEIEGIREKLELLLEKSDDDQENEQDVTTLNLQDNILDLSNQLTDLIEKVNSTQGDNLQIESSLDEISQKLDILAINNDSVEFETDNDEVIRVLSEKIDDIATITVDNSAIEEQIEEIKKLVKSQKSFAEALKKMVESTGTNVDLSDIESTLNDKLETFEQKLSDFTPAQEDTKEQIQPSIDLKDEFENFKSEILESIIALFDQISFIEETEEIKDFVAEEMDNLKAQIKNISTQSMMATSEDGSINIGIDDILSRVDDNYLDMRDEFISKVGDSYSEIKDAVISTVKNEVISSVKDEVLSNVDNNYSNIKNEISLLKKHLSQSNIDDEDYTLQDVESDIAKVRVILKELSDKSSSANNSNFSNYDLAEINENLTSLSSRTNKILLNSDESSAALKENLSDLKDVLNLFENKIQAFDSARPINNIERKIDRIGSMVKTNVQSDKIFNQTFMYLAEWIDKADEKLDKLEAKVSDISYVKQNMIKKSDLESMFEKFVKKIDKQQEKIKSLEEKIKELSKKESIIKPTATNIKTIVKEVLSKVETTPKSNTTLVKKVDGIDRQLMNLGKSIEKITSYVDD